MPTFTLLQNTAPWTYPLMGYLILVGIKATKSRTVPYTTLFFPPITFTLLTILSVINYIHAAVFDFYLWCAATLIFILIGWLTIDQTRLKYDTLNQTFKIAGSKGTLVLTAIILSFRYYIDYQLAVGKAALPLIIWISISNGLFGIFVGRLLVYIAHANKHSIEE